MGTIRLGKRTENRSPLIKDFVPLATLDDIVFGGWDIFDDNAYDAAKKAGVLREAISISVADFMKSIKPMPAVFDSATSSGSTGPNVKKGKNKSDLAEQLIGRTCATSSRRTDCDRLVMVWCGSTEIFMQPGPAARDARGVREGDGRERRGNRAVACSTRTRRSRRASRSATARRTCRSTSRPARARQADSGVPISGKDFKTGQTLMKTIIAPGLKARMLGLEGWYSTNILGNRDGEVLDDPESFKTKEESQAQRARLHPAAGALPGPLQGLLARRAHQLLPAARRQQGRLGQHRHRRLARLPDADQDRTSSAATRSSRRRSCSTSRCSSDFAQRAGM